MACGRAVVSADVAGAREALAAAGPVVPVDDVDALGAAVAARLLDPADLAARGQELRVRAVEFFDRAASCAGVADFEMRCAGLPVPHAPRPAPELIRDAAAPATQGAVTRLSSRKP